MGYYNRFTHPKYRENRQIVYVRTPRGFHFCITRVEYVRKSLAPGGGELFGYNKGREVFMVLFPRKSPRRFYLTP